jgi:hypothetical protein
MPTRTPMNRAELLALPSSVDLATAGRALGLGRTKSHELAAVAGDSGCKGIGGAVGGGAGFQKSAVAVTWVNEATRATG